MKIGLINSFIHKKNKDALLTYTNEYVNINVADLDKIDISSFDMIYSPSIAIDVSKYPNAKFIFGPHFSVFPHKNAMDKIRGKNSIYIQPSEWAVDVWKNNPFCKGIKFESIPFGVETLIFNEIIPIKDRNDVFIYYKTRNPNELKELLTFFSKKNIVARIFNYDKKYDEKDYINFLQKSKFGIWLGRHESQGFALEEALSCNVPLLVWNTTSMNQEFRSNYENIPATTIPYWDERCGEYFTEISELPKTFEKFIAKINDYKPREYILENLSMKKCNDLFNNLINKFIQ